MEHPCGNIRTHSRIPGILEISGLAGTLRSLLLVLPRHIRLDAVYSRANHIVDTMRGLRCELDIGLVWLASTCNPLLSHCSLSLLGFLMLSGPICVAERHAKAVMGPATAASTQSFQIIHAFLGVPRNLFPIFSFLSIICVAFAGASVFLGCHRHAIEVFERRCLVASSLLFSS